MKRVFSLIMAAVLCLLTFGCGNSESAPDTQQAAQALKSLVAGGFKNEDYYIQMSRTQAEAHTVTEVSKMGDDKCFLSYDAKGTLNFFRNGKLTNVSAETLYTPEETDGNWDSFSYDKTAVNYREVLKKLCSDSDDKYPAREIKCEKSDNEKYPYKLAIFYDLTKFDCKELFSSGGTFGSLAVRCLTDSTGSKFDSITLQVQYDYNNEIFVIAATYGTPKTPDENNGNGQRPQDVEEVYNGYLEKLQNSFEEYLQSLQDNISR